MSESTENTETKRTYTGKHRVAPMLTAKEKESKTYFTVNEVASLVNRTAVRLWQLLVSGKIPFVNVAKEGSTNRKIRIPRSALPLVREHFGRKTYAYAVAQVDGAGEVQESVQESSSQD
jgi:hypothetical protein